jgi:hypothetical protein
VSSTTERAPREIFDEYKAQTEVVHREKRKLQELNNELLLSRDRCIHAFENGACVNCGANEQIWKMVGQENLKHVRE